MEKIKIAAIQMPTVADKMENVRTVKACLLYTSPSPRDRG